MGGALVPAVMQFANYEQGLADLRAAANADVGQMELVKQSIENLSKTTGIDPNEVADGYRQLLFAGVKLDEVLGGAGETLIKFARVGLMPAGEAALTLVKAVNVFSREGMTMARAADVMTQAASASSISIKDVTDAFAAGGSAGAEFGQTMKDMAVAIGILGNNGLVGADAGTALKVMMLELVNPGNEAASAIAELGFSFKDAAGQLLPLPQIIDRLNTSLAGKTDGDRNRLLAQLGGHRGIRGWLPLIREGLTGWNTFADGMEKSLTVEQRFAIMNDTLLASLKKVWVHIQYFAIAVGEALAPALRTIGMVLMPILTALQKFISSHKDLVIAYAFDAVKAIAFGAALYSIGLLMNGIGIAAGILAGILTALPMAVIFVGVVTVLYLLLQLFPEVGAAIGSFVGGAFREASLLGTTAFNSIKDAMTGVVELINAGDLENAFAVAKLGMEILWLQFKSFMLRVWDEILAGFLSRWQAVQNTIATGMAEYLGISGVNTPTGVSTGAFPGLSAAQSREANLEAQRAAAGSGFAFQSADWNRVLDEALADAINRRYVEQEAAVGREFNPAGFVRVVNGRVIGGPTIAAGNAAPANPEVQALENQITALTAQQRTLREGALAAAAENSAIAALPVDAQEMAAFFRDERNAARTAGNLEEQMRNQTLLDSTIEEVTAMMANLTTRPTIATPDGMPAGIGGAFGSFSGGALAGYAGTAMDRVADNTANLLEVQRGQAADTQEVVGTLRQILENGGGLLVL